MQSTPPSEQRSALIGVLLIAVIWFVWMWQFSPAPPEENVPPTAQEPPVVDSQAARERARAQEQTEAAAMRTAEAEAGVQERAVTADSAVTGALQGAERLITVETDLYTATFSTRGATLTSFKLKAYNQFDQETPVQLVSQDERGALSLAFTTPESHNVDTRAFYFDAQVAGRDSLAGDTLRVAQDSLALTFTASLGAGQIRQTYLFQAGSYEVGLRVAMEDYPSFATGTGYEVVWHGGLPFSEDHPETEAQKSGGFARSGGEIVKILLQDEDQQNEYLAGDVSWTAVKNKYFTAVVIPDASGETRAAELVGEKVTEEEGLWENYTTRLMMPAPAGEADAFRLYLGPMDYHHLAVYDLNLYDMVDYGWDFFEWMTRPLAKYFFIPLFSLLSSFIPSYGIVIILLAVIVKLLVYPLTKSSYKSMAKMRELQPRMEEIREKYGDDSQKQQQQMMKLYKETGVNPVGGCLPMLLQYPVLITLWMFLPTSIAIRQQGFLWASDLSVPDVILDLPFTIPFYGDYVAGFTLLMGLSMIFTMQMQSPTSAAGGGQMKVLTYIFPFFIFFIFNRFAAGLSLYYLAYNIMTAAQQQWINRQMDEEQAEPGTNGRGRKQDAESSWLRRKLART